MFRRMRTLAVSLMVVAAAALGVVSSAAAWTTTCSSGAQKVCVYIDTGWGVPMATMNGDKDDYGSSTYPNTTQNIIDTVSSVKNRYASSDIRFHFHADQGGESCCSNADTSSAPGHLRAFPYCNRVAQETTVPLPGLPPQEGMSMNGCRSRGWPTGLVVNGSVVTIALAGIGAPFDAHARARPYRCRMGRRENEAVQ